MIVAGVLIETAPGAAPRVAARLVEKRGGGFELHGGDGDHRLAAVFVGDDGKALEAAAERLIAEHPEVIGVFPAYVADDREDRDEAGRSALDELKSRGGDAR